MKKSKTKSKPVKKSVVKKSIAKKSIAKKTEKSVVKKLAEPAADLLRTAQNARRQLTQENEALRKALAEACDLALDSADVITSFDTVISPEDDEATDFRVGILQLRALSKLPEAERHIARRKFKAEQDAVTIQNVRKIREATEARKAREAERMAREAAANAQPSESSVRTPVLTEVQRLALLNRSNEVESDVTIDTPIPEPVVPASTAQPVATDDVIDATALLLD